MRRAEVPAHAAARWGERCGNIRSNLSFNRKEELTAQDSPEPANRASVHAIMFRGVKVEVARDWLDYAQAFGGLGSVVLALAALVLAIRSAQDSGRSADAAERTAQAAGEEAELSRKMTKHVEEQLRIQREESEARARERQRRPAFARPVLSVEGMLDPSTDLSIAQVWRGLGMSLSAGLSGSLPDDIPLWLVIVRATFENEGDMAVDLTLARFAIPETVTLWRSGPAGDHLEDVDLQRVEDLTLRAGAVHQGAHAHAWRIQRLPPGHPEMLHATLAFRQPGEFEVELQVEHEEADPVAQRYLVAVPETGLAHTDITEESASS